MSPLTQVCLAFCANFALKNSVNAAAVKEGDVLPLIAYHHLNGRPPLYWAPEPPMMGS